MPSDDEIKGILIGSGGLLSHWFQTSLTSALVRDPVDAANDAALLTLVLNQRAGQIATKAQADLALYRAKKPRDL